MNWRKFPPNQKLFPYKFSSSQTRGKAEIEMLLLIRPHSIQLSSLTMYVIQTHLLPSSLYIYLLKKWYIYNVNDENFSNILFWRSIFVSIKKKKEDILQIYCIYIMTCCYFCVCCVYIFTIMLQTWKKKKNVGFFISYSHNIWDSILQFKLLK